MSAFSGGTRLQPPQSPLTWGCLEERPTFSKALVCVRNLFLLLRSFPDCVSECESFLTHIHVFYMLMCQASRLNGPVTANSSMGSLQSNGCHKAALGYRDRSETPSSGRRTTSPDLAHRGGTMHCLPRTLVSLLSLLSLLSLWPLRMFLKVDKCEVILLPLS